MNIVICLVTAPTRDVGAQLARSVVEQRLAACVNIVPGVESVYRWKGEVTLDEEVLLVIKSTQELLGTLQEVICKEHPYDVPEFVVLSPSSVSTEYAQWVRESVLSAAAV